MATTEASQRKAQQCVYAAAASMSDLRCGDLVDVEWESEWFPGVVTDVPASEELAVSYTNGDFEDSVPSNVVRMRVIPPRKRPGEDKKGKKVSPSVKLRNGANAGDIGLVMEALRQGADAREHDELGYCALHWAAGPDEGMPGDTISRRACIALLARVGDMDAKDTTHLGLRAVQHSVTKNLVGCVKTFHHVGCSFAGTVHWAVSMKAHGTVRELLRLGVPYTSSKLEWDGCSPLMLAASGNDAYGIHILIDYVRSTKGDAAVAAMIAEVQMGKLKSSALHYAADHAADSAVKLLLELDADPSLRSARGETALTLVKRRAAEAEQTEAYPILEAALQCKDLLEAALAEQKARKRESNAVVSPSKMIYPKGKRKLSKAAMAAAAEAEAAAAEAAEREAEEAAVREAEEAAAAEEAAEEILTAAGGPKVEEGSAALSGADDDDDYEVDRMDDEDSEALVAGDDGDESAELDLERTPPPLDYAIDAAAVAAFEKILFANGGERDPGHAAGCASASAGGAGGGAGSSSSAGGGSAQSRAGDGATAGSTASASAMPSEATSGLVKLEQGPAGGPITSASEPSSSFGEAFRITTPSATLRRHAAAIRTTAAGADGSDGANPASSSELSIGGSSDEDWVVYVAAAYTAIWAVDGEECREDDEDDEGWGGGEGEECYEGEEDAGGEGGEEGSEGGQLLLSAEKASLPPATSMPPPPAIQGGRLDDATPMET